MSPLPVPATASQERSNSILVKNIPSHVLDARITTLFNTLIGQINGIQSLGKGALELRFSSRALAKKALDLNGYYITEGCPLAVELISCGRQADPKSKENIDPRRNLYVLGLPFALTKSELASMFSKYGRVLHCVILATVDNSSRRRGFVVMSSHEEAKRAMDALSNASLKGGQALDISWAVVQRSKGFLDGGDREVFHDSFQADSNTHQGSLSSDVSSSLSPNQIEGEPSPSPLASSRVPTSILLFKNLPKMLFSSPQDLQPLLYPYGRVNTLEVLEVDFIKGTLPGSVSVVAEYADLDGALQALEGLKGQCYAEYKISVEFLKPMNTPRSSANSSCNSSATSFSSRHRPSQFVINSHKQSFKNNAPLSSNTDSSISASTQDDTFASRRNSLFKPSKVANAMSTIPVPPQHILHHTIPCAANPYHLSGPRPAMNPHQMHFPSTVSTYTYFNHTLPTAQHVQNLSSPAFYA